MEFKEIIDFVEKNKKEYLNAEINKQKCPACGEEVENGEDGMMEHYIVCEGEQ